MAAFQTWRIFFFIAANFHILKNLFFLDMLQVWKAAICAILIRQQKVSSSRNSSRTEFFRFAIKSYPFLYKKWFKLHPKIWLFGPNQAYPKSVPSVHTQKWSIYFFENKIATHGTQILRNKFRFDQIAQKMNVRCLFMKKKLTVCWGQMSVNLNWCHIYSILAAPDKNLCAKWFKCPLL